MSTTEINSFMGYIVDKNPNEPEFHQAVKEFAQNIIPFLIDNPEYGKNRILHRIVEPDKTISFKICWADDLGIVHVNKGWRVQFNNSLGPYKGGLRFHPSVNLSILKFLGFEQCFKNSLTGLPLGGAKGGSDFNPRRKSDLEIMRFCQAYMSNLFRYIGENTDVPAGDIGVGPREIGYLYGQYKKISNTHVGVLTGKGLEYGGSLIRKEATGYGCVYFCENMLNNVGDSIAGKKCIVSGSGNVGIYAAEKAIELGAAVVAMSDSSGFIYDKNGIDVDKLEIIKNIKEIRRGELSECASKYPSMQFHKGKVWNVDCDIAFPCATQNELDENDAKSLIANNIIAISEGANMPLTSSATKALVDKDVLIGPGKAANAGGVAVSGLEMSQNSMHINWDRKNIDTRLQSIMLNIHGKCVQHGKNKNKQINYIKGANIAGFIKIANAMIAQGIF